MSSRGSTGGTLEWLAALLAVVTSAWRSLNLGHQAATYLVSAACYVVFLTRPGISAQQRFTHVFYLCTAGVGCVRWWGGD